MLYCSTGVSNIVRFKDNEGRRVVQFDIHEKAVLFGFYDTGNITFQVTTKEKEKNTATQTTASLINGMLQINQEFHMSDSELGGTLLEDHASFTEPRIHARIALSEAQHTVLYLKILDNNSCSFLFSIEGGSVITVDSSLVPITQYQAIKTQGIKEKT